MKKVVALIAACIMGLVLCTATAQEQELYTFAGIPWDLTLENALEVAEKQIGVPFTKEQNPYEKNMVDIVTPPHSQLSILGVPVESIKLSFSTKEKQEYLSTISIQYKMPYIAYLAETTAPDSKIHFAIEDPSAFEIPFNHFFEKQGKPDLTTVDLLITFNAKANGKFQIKEGTLLENLLSLETLARGKFFFATLRVQFKNTYFFLILSDDGAVLDGEYSQTFISPRKYDHSLTKNDRPVLSFTTKDLSFD